MKTSRKMLILFFAWTAALVLAPQAQVVTTGSIGDTVFLDHNANDLPDPGEGAPGVTLTLYDDTGVNVLATTVTDANGQYLFAGLATGTYVVAVATNTLPGFPGQWTNTVDPDGGILNRAMVTLPHAPTSGPSSVSLGTSENFVVLGASTVTSTGDTTVDGDLGLSPGPSVTGFPPGIVSNGTIHVNDAPANQAQLDWVTANNALTLSVVDATLAPDLGGTIQTPGVYDSSDGSFGITGTLTLDAQGDPNAVFIFKAASTLITAGSSDVVLTNGAQAGNVFWQVGSSATLGTTSIFRGNILALASISLTTGATVEGRVWAHTAAVTMDGNHVGLPRLAGENDLDLDFGYRRDAPNTISGTLWEDLDEDGLLDSGESVRFVGVTVELRLAAGTVIGTVATDAAGGYSFTNLPDASYVVDVTDTGNVLAGYVHSIGPSPGANNNSQTDPYSVAVSGGETDSTGDFGYFFDDGGPAEPASLGDFVWNDINGNGIQNTGELGVSGVGVTLYNSASVAVRTTLTSVAGQYIFANLAPGVYHVGFTLPTGFVISPQDQGGDDARDSDVNAATRRTVPTTLVAGENDLTWDMGIYRPASLGDFVWNDINGNGIQNTGELGVSGVGVTLYNSASVAVRTTLTSVAGKYGFTNLVPGVYHVGFTLPTGFVISPQDQGGDDARDSDVSAATRRTVPTTLVAGENDLTWDMGIYRPASLGDFVWNDVNGNGIQNTGELGVSGVGVTLYNSASVAVRTTLTSVAGQYRFTNLAPGVYHVGFTLPTGFVISPQDQGGDDARDSDANATTRRTVPTTLVAGENDLTWDMGLYSGPPLLAVIGNVDAFTRDGQTIVRWETIESWGTAGFWLERQVGDQWVRISQELIPFPLFEPSPIIYEEVDPGAVAGGTYIYRLVELESDGDELTYGPYTLTVDGPGRTYADWAAEHFTAAELADPAISGPDADPDGDGLTNWQEFLAGTDPINADSLLQVTSVRRVEEGLELRWKSVAGRYYRIALSDSMFGPFLPLEQSILATDENGQVTLSVDFQDRQLYFQVILMGE